LIGFSIYGLVYETIYGEHFFEYFKNRSSAASADLFTSIKLYYTIVCSIGVGYGVLLLIMGGGGIPARKGYFIDRYGQERSYAPGFCCWFFIAFIVASLVAVILIFTAMHGQYSNSNTTSDESIMNSFISGINRVFENCVKFYELREDDFRFLLYLSGGISSAVAALEILWEALGCILICSATSIYERRDHIDVQDRMTAHVGSAAPVDVARPRDWVKYDEKGTTFIEMRNTSV
jgi:hypothetical protein